jgi:hypothetical protein
VHPFLWLTASWGQDLPQGNFMEDAPYQLGIAALGMVILSAALVRNRAAGNSFVGRSLWFSIVASAVLLAMMLPPLAPVWNVVGLSLLVQYPFQLLALVGVLLTLGASTLVLSDDRLRGLPLLAALLSVPVLAVYPYLAPQYLDLSPTRPALARLNGNEIALLDARIVRPPGVWRHGATVELDLTWQALRRPSRDYTIFFQIVDENGQEWGGVDARLQDGATSTLNWIPGRVVSNTHSIQIDLNGPPEAITWNWVSMPGPRVSAPLRKRQQPRFALTRTVSALTHS